jgi:Mce-associated membrane protein
VDVTPAGTKTPTTDRKRLEAVLVRTGGGEWKVKALDAVPLARTAEEDDGR